MPNPTSTDALLDQVFSRGASGYAEIRYFWHYGRRLAGHAQLEPGQHVLDAACGRGASLFPAAEQVGPGGRAVGIDLAQQMVAETRLEAGRRGLSQVHVEHMSAEHLTFADASFDALVCGFALPFMPRLGQALAEMRRVLRPGGRLVASTWGAGDERWAWLDELLLAHGAVRPMRAQPLETPASLAEALVGGGFADAQIVVDEFELFYQSPEEWWSNLWSISMRAGLEQLDPPAVERLKAAAFERVEALRGPRGIPFRLQALIGVAHSGMKP